MATTTATITLASSDIMDNAISVSSTATLTKAGNSTGLPDTLIFLTLQQLTQTKQTKFT